MSNEQQFVPEFQVREVRRYVVTRYGDNTSRVIGEFPSFPVADQVAAAMAKVQGGVVRPNHIQHSAAREAAEQ
jgi:hypothetical protein